MKQSEKVLITNERIRRVLAPHYDWNPNSSFRVVSNCDVSLVATVAHELGHFWHLPCIDLSSEFILDDTDFVGNGWYSQDSHFEKDKLTAWIERSLSPDSIIQNELEARAVNVGIAQVMIEQATTMAQVDEQRNLIASFSEPEVFAILETEKTKAVIQRVLAELRLNGLIK